MSKQYDNTNSGTLFKNDMEGKSENFPPYGGSLNVGGVDYWISAWVKEGQKGKFFSLAIKPKDGQSKPAPQRQAPQQSAPVDDFDDSIIPF